MRVQTNWKRIQHLLKFVLVEGSVLVDIELVEDMFRALHRNWFAGGRPEIHSEFQVDQQQALVQLGFVNFSRTIGVDLIEGVVADVSKEGRPRKPTAAGISLCSGTAFFEDYRDRSGFVGNYFRYFGFFLRDLVAVAETLSGCCFVSQGDQASLRLSIRRRVILVIVFEPILVL